MHKDLPSNVLYVAQGHEVPALQSTMLVAQDVSYIAGHAPTQTKIAAKSRYRQSDSACDFIEHSDGFELQFAAPQWAVTPGQSAVLYDGEVCLGGGIIMNGNPDLSPLF